MNELASKLYHRAESSGLISVLEPFGATIQVSIPMTKSFCEQRVEDLNFSVRAYNGLKRAGVVTVEDINNLIMREVGLGAVRNIGRKTISEIKTVLLVRGYEALSSKNKIAFWEDFVQNNEIPQGAV